MGFQFLKGRPDSIVGRILSRFWGRRFETEEERQASLDTAIQDPKWNRAIIHGLEYPLEAGLPPGWRWLTGPRPRATGSTGEHVDAEGDNVEECIRNAWRLVASRNYTYLKRRGLIEGVES